MTPFYNCQKIYNTKKEPESQKSPRKENHIQTVIECIRWNNMENYQI